MPDISRTSTSILEFINQSKGMIWHMLQIELIRLIAQMKKNLLVKLDWF